MSRRSVLMALAAIVATAIGGAIVLVLLVRHEPAQYAGAPMPEEPAERQERSQEFTKRLIGLINAINADHEWDEQFSDEQINSYLDDEFIRSGVDRRLLPEGISRPRVIFGNDTIRLAFRYGSGVWSTVVSIDLRAWVPKCEPNVVALELIGFHAGALPISAQSLLERVAEVGRQSNIDIAWYRTNGHPVALLRFGADQPRTTVLLDTVKLQPGLLAVKGHAIDSTSASAMLPAPESGQQPPEVEAAAQ
jgi:hypothetical protein